MTEPNDADQAPTHDTDEPMTELMRLGDTAIVIASDRQPWMCNAHLRDGSGELCRKPRMVGQMVCASHGGQAPQNVAAARRRLLEAIDPIMAELVEVAMQPSGFCPHCGRQADALKLRAIIAAVDRALMAGPDLERGPDEPIGEIRLVIVRPGDVLPAPAPSPTPDDADELTVDVE